MTDSSLQVTYEDAAKSPMLIRVDDDKNLAELRKELIGRKLMQDTDVFIAFGSIVHQETELQINHLPAPKDGVRTIKLGSSQKPPQGKPAQVLTVQSDKDDQDVRPVRIADPAALILSGLRATLGSWLDARDRFLTKQKGVIEDTDEARWPVSDVADNGIIRVRRAAWSR